MKLNYILILIFLLGGINLKAQKKVKYPSKTHEKHVGKIIFSSEYIYKKKTDESLFKNQFNLTESINLRVYLKNSLNRLVGGGNFGELKWTVSINGVEIIELERVSHFEEGYWTKRKTLSVKMFAQLNSSTALHPNKAYQNAILNCGIINKDIEVKISLHATKKEKEPISDLFLAEGTFTIKAFTKEAYEDFKGMSMAKEEFKTFDIIQISAKDEKMLLDKFKIYAKYGNKEVKNYKGKKAIWSHNNWKVETNPYTSVPLLKYKQFLVVFEIGDDSLHCYVSRYVLVSQYSGGGNYSASTFEEQVDPNVHSIDGTIRPFPCMTIE
jgi:hypothetical protein